jgi:hypothetical protein
MEIHLRIAEIGNLEDKIIKNFRVNRGCGTFKLARGI